MFKSTALSLSRARVFASRASRENIRYARAVCSGHVLVYKVPRRRAFRNEFGRAFFGSRPVGIGVGRKNVANGEEVLRINEANDDNV